MLIELEKSPANLSADNIDIIDEVEKTENLVEQDSDAPEEPEDGKNDDKLALTPHSNDEVEVMSGTHSN